MASEPGFFSVRLAPRADTKPALLQLTQSGDVLGVQKLLRGLGEADAVHEVMRAVDGDDACTATLCDGSSNRTACGEHRQALLSVRRAGARKHPAPRYSFFGARSDLSKRHRNPPLMICVNDNLGDFAEEEDIKEVRENLHAFYERLLPRKSSFEV